MGVRTGRNNSQSSHFLFAARDTLQMRAEPPRQPPDASSIAARETEGLCEPINPAATSNAQVNPQNRATRRAAELWQEPCDQTMKPTNGEMAELKRRLWLSLAADPEGGALRSFGELPRWALRLLPSVFGDQVMHPPNGPTNARASKVDAIGFQSLTPVLSKSSAHTNRAHRLCLYT